MERRQGKMQVDTSCSPRDASSIAVIIITLISYGCVGPGASSVDASVDDVPRDSPDLADEDTTWEDVVDDGETDPAFDDVSSSPCPSLMVLVDGTFCIDRFEAALEEQGDDGSWSPASPYDVVDGRTMRAVPADGIVPQGYISGLEAAVACEAAGKRLCSSAEWLLACRGPEDWVYPYGTSHVDDACNDHYDGTHPVVDFFGTSEGIWDAVHMNDPGINQQPGTLAAGGARPGCESAWGAFDMHGNLHEWTDDPSGTFRGGFYADASINGPGCTYVTTAHASSYHDYSTGFRCCADP